MTTEEINAELSGKKPTATATKAASNQEDTDELADLITQHTEEIPVEDDELAQEPEPTNTRPFDVPSQARQYLKLFNILQAKIFTALYKKNMLEPEDLERYEAWHTAKNSKEVLHSDHELWPVQNRLDRYVKAVRGVKLTEDEIGDLTEPLAEILVKHRFMQLGPEATFLIALGIVLFSRMTPLFGDHAEDLFDFPA
jgi:hypothetical protein